MATSQLETIANKIAAEIARVGADYAALGPCDSLECSVHDGRVRVYDDGYGCFADPVATLANLQALPDGAGWEAAWEAVVEA